MLPSRTVLLALALSACAAEVAETAANDAAVDAMDIPAPQDVLRVSDVTDVSDVSDVTDASDVVDAGIARDVPADTRDAGASPDAPDVPTPLGPVLYPADRAHSPITASIAAGLRAIAAAGATQPRVFAKVGDSNTVNTNFSQCFAGNAVDLGGRGHLADTLAHFRGGDVAGTDPFRRTSLAATVGWSAWAALAGSPSPLARELDATNARYAVVMFGTNDIQSRDLHRYGQNLLDIAEQTAARGAVPIITSIPPRDDSADADLWVPRYVAVMRGVAQAQQVPFVDLERALRALPDHGLGPDGLHMTAYGGTGRACALTPAGLRYGFNVRNLVTLEALDRARAALDGAPPPDATAPRFAGEGTAAQPYEIPSLPFADARDTRRSGARGIDRYPGCMSATDESGPELVYRLTVRAPTRIRALVLSRGGADIDVHLLGAQVSGAACVARNDQMVTATLTPGVWHLSLDTFASAGSARAGRYVLVVMPD